MSEPDDDYPHGRWSVAKEKEDFARLDLDPWADFNAILEASALLLDAVAAMLEEHKDELALEARRLAANLREEKR